jgi:hypothetical protein
MAKRLGKRHRGSPRGRRKGNYRVNCRDIGCTDLKWIDFDLVLVVLDLLILLFDILLVIQLINSY